MNGMFLFKVDGCENHTVLSEADRAQGYVSQSNGTCERKVRVTGWYRFQGAAGDRIPDKCVPMWRCGTKHPGWLSGKHPTVAEGVVIREVCSSHRENCCAWRININVKNCGSYYVYELPRTPYCNSRYCGNAGACKLHSFDTMS
jgi:hypothetical protein